jgi:hypothetical protein
MVYKYHKKWRDQHPIDSSVWDICELSKEEKKQVFNMRKSKPIIPYTLEIECTSYWGNFEREFLGYSIGILDDVQMHINHSKAERALFWKEVFNKQPIDFIEASESYELYKDYLLETFQGCDDWEQLCFYYIDFDIYHKNGSNVLKIQLAQPLSKEWEDIIIPRMKDFFIDKVYPYMTEEGRLISITLCNRKGEVVKEY